MRKKRKINERPDEVVCVCEKSGNISLYDPGTWRRAQAIKRKKEGQKDDR